MLSFKLQILGIQLNQTNLSAYDKCSQKESYPQMYDLKASSYCKDGTNEAKSEIAWQFTINI